jgi:hypothetical protein
MDVSIVSQFHEDDQVTTYNRKNRSKTHAMEREEPG